MNERQTSLRRIRLQRDLYEDFYQRHNMQIEERQKTLEEIINTGDSLKYGESLRLLDTLLALPIKKRRAEDKAKLAESLSSLKKAFGPTSVGEVYDSWKSSQVNTSLK